MNKRKKKKWKKRKKDINCKTTILLKIVKYILFVVR